MFPELINQAPGNMNPTALPIINMTGKILNHNTRPINCFKGITNGVSSNWCAGGEWTESSTIKIMVVVYC